MLAKISEQEKELANLRQQLASMAAVQVRLQSLIPAESPQPPASSTPAPAAQPPQSKGDAIPSRDNLGEGEGKGKGKEKGKEKAISNLATSAKGSSTSTVAKDKGGSGPAVFVMATGSSSEASSASGSEGAKASLHEEPEASSGDSKKDKVHLRDSEHEAEMERMQPERKTHIVPDEDEADNQDSVRSYMEQRAGGFLNQMDEVLPCHFVDQYSGVPQCGKPPHM